MADTSSQLRTVGTAFLLKRPVIVAPGAVMGLTGLVLADVPSPQLASLSVGLLGMLTFFGAEAWHCRTTPVSARWLSWSLRITVTGLSLVCAASGGLRSPFVPLVLAPVVIAFAAFGRTRTSATMAAHFAVAIAALAMVGPGWPWPAIPGPYDIFMTATASILALMLAYVGVAQLSDALGTSREALLRTREHALVAATDRLKSLEAIGSRVAHELNNPLASIKGLAQLSARSSCDPRMRKRFEVVLTAAAHMEDVLEDYLSFSRPLDDLNLQALDVDALVHDAVELVSVRAHARSIEIACDGTAGPMHADRRLLLDALLNLLTNAVEACAAGRRVTVTMQRSDARVEIEVHDEGHGLSQATLARLGTPYFTTKAHGTGLGVVTAMAAIRQHGGELRFACRHPRGTTASIVLPLRLLQPAQGTSPCPR